MPHTTAIIDNRGPLVTVHIGLSTQRAEALGRAGLVPPLPVSCNLLIDTGASQTSIDIEIIEALGLSPTGSIMIHTPSTGANAHATNTYDVSMFIFGHQQQPKIIQALPVIGCHFGAQGIQGLLGRDVLAMSRLIYSGYDNIVMLSIL